MKEQNAILPASVLELLRCYDQSRVLQPPLNEFRSNDVEGYSATFATLPTYHVCKCACLPHGRVPLKPSHACQVTRLSACQPVTARFYHHPATRGTVDLRRSPRCQSLIAIVETNPNPHYGLGTALKKRVELKTLHQPVSRSTSVGSNSVLASQRQGEQYEIWSQTASLSMKRRFRAMKIDWHTGLSHPCVDRLCIYVRRSTGELIYIYTGPQYTPVLRFVLDNRQASKLQASRPIQPARRVHYASRNYHRYTLLCLDSFCPSCRVQCPRSHRALRRVRKVANMCGMYRSKAFRPPRNSR